MLTSLHFVLTSVNTQSRSSFLVACFSNSLLITRTQWQGTYRNSLRTKKPDEVTLNANESYDKGFCCQDMLQSLPWKKDNALPWLITNNWHSFKLIQSKWWKYWMMFSLLFIRLFIMSNTSDVREQVKGAVRVECQSSTATSFRARWVYFLLTDVVDLALLGTEIISKGILSFLWMLSFKVLHFIKGFDVCDAD